ncbi:transporter substrate-binding domain-containing protein [Brevibacterium sp. 50QC2O2]|uniref:transporter substrate-binding domain-containing protein n=1 Tax=unclassified Brevibacterium TaxID=2614124 RepID=UPI00211CF37F|nr:MULTISPECIES: transporter substrate-binding domain-containing protein [unclassified Brevibacterium]MCQ9367044.1 transporter substrate-binding domain-containing protein [Brevibacterium sp. 91QC2O2]MCQ9388272.1 transporter substrate-binding domain-containing protein [Brevibacterium sp. 50QC2O2]
MNRLIAFVAIACVGLLTACGGGDAGGSEQGGSGSAPATVAKDDAVAGKVPEKFKGGVNVAVYSDWAPEEYVENGEFKGWSVELAKIWSQKMGTAFKLNASGFDSIVPGMENGRYDMAVASLGVTDERIKTLDFVPMQKEGTSFAWAKTKPDNKVTKVEEACGKSVAVLTGAWEYDYLTKNMKKLCASSPMDIQQFKDQPSAELAVTSGRVDLVAAGSGKLGYAAQQSGSLDVGDFIVNAVYNGVGVPKGSELGPVLRAAMQSAIDDGSYEKLRRSYGASEAGDLKKAVLLTEDQPNG